MREEGRGKREEGRGKREAGREKRGRAKREAGSVGAAQLGGSKRGLAPIYRPI